MLDLSPELNALAEKAIGAAIEVHRQLGPGFKEITYGNALAIELTLRGIAFEREVPVRLGYKGHSIGDGQMDFLVEKQLVLELKALEGSIRKFDRQASAYLKATDLQLCLVMNFHVELLRDGIMRIINSPTSAPGSAPSVSPQTPR